MSAAYIFEAILLFLICLYGIVHALMKNIQATFGPLFKYYVISLLAMALRIASCLIGQMEDNPQNAGDLNYLCDCASYGASFFACFWLMVNIREREDADVPKSRRLMQYVYPVSLTVWLMVIVLDSATNKPSSPAFIIIVENTSYYICMLSLLYSLLAVKKGAVNYILGRESMVLSKRLKVVTVLVLANVVTGLIQTFLDIGNQVTATEWFDVLSDLSVYLTPLVCFCYPEDYGFGPAPATATTTDESKNKKIEEASVPGPALAPVSEKKDSAPQVVEVVKQEAAAPLLPAPQS